MSRRGHSPVTADEHGTEPADRRVSGRALDLRLLWRVWTYVRPYRRALLISVVLLPVISALEVAQPYLLRHAIDDHIAPHRLEGLNRLGLLYLVALLGQYAAGFAQSYLVQLAGQHAMNDLRQAAHRHVLRLSSAFFDRTPVGQLMTRMTSDIESLTEMFASGLISLIGDVVRLALIVAVMFQVDARLAAFSLIAVPVLAVLAALFRGWVRDAFREIRAKLARMNGFLQEHLGGIKVVQAFAQEERVARGFDVVNREYRRANARAIGADAALYSVVEAVAAIAVAALLWHGAGRLVAGALTFGVLVQFTEYVGKFFAPLRDLSAKYTVMQQAVAAAERVFGLLHTEDLDAPGPSPHQASPSSPNPFPTASGAPLPSPNPVVIPSGAAALPSPNPLPAWRGEGRERGERSELGEPPAVQFDRVSFEYRPNLPVLQDLWLDIRAGETVAIVGATGAGKSSLIKLLARLYEPQHGTIRLNGTDIRDWPREALRRHLVSVNQDVFLFSGTIAENIELGDPSIDQAKIWAAIRAVGAEPLIARRPGGLDARVTERGANFSAGERQLIAFARALCRDPQLLVLDEATSSIDPEIERLIEQAIAHLMNGRTSIVIAHRLSTIRRAHRIVVLEHGRIAEQGTHADLLAANGVYARLYSLQTLQLPRALPETDGRSPKVTAPLSGPPETTR